MSSPRGPSHARSGKNVLSSDRCDVNPESREERRIDMQLHRIPSRATHRFIGDTSGGAAELNKWWGWLEVTHFGRCELRLCV